MHEFIYLEESTKIPWCGTDREYTDRDWGYCNCPQEWEKRVRLVRPFLHVTEAIIIGRYVYKRISSKALKD